MTDLSPEAKRALNALRSHVASDAEHARVRARLAAIGVGATAAAATSVAAKAAAAGVTAGEGVSAAGTLAGASTGSAAVGAIHSAAASQVAAGSSVFAKLAGLSVAAKVGASAALVAGSAAWWSAAQGAPVPRAQRAAVVVQAPARSAQAPLAARGAELLRREEPAPDVPPTLPPSSVVDAPELRPKRQDLRAPARVPALLRGRTEPTAAPVSPGLAEETALLGAALRALRAGDLYEARALVERHAREFAANARLAEERERLREELERTFP